MECPPERAEDRSTDVHDELLDALVGDLDRFEERSFGRRPLHRPAHGDLAVRFRELLDVDDVDRIIASGARAPTFRLVRDGSTLPPTAGTRRSRLGGKDVDDVADPDRVADEFARGATVVLQSLQRTWRPVDLFCRRLERALGHAVQANAYLTPPGSTGLAAHADEHDVIVLHVHGSKTWEIDDVGPLTLRPGDVLYLPAGVRHAATAQVVTSLHLTIGILRTTLGDVLRRVLSSDPSTEWSRPLPVGFDRPERRPELVAALRSAAEATRRALDDLDVEPLADEAARRRISTRRRDGHRRLSSVVASRSLDPSSHVVLRQDRRVDRRPELDGEGRVVVELPGRRLRLPAAMGAALDVLLSGSVVRIDQLPGLDDGDRQVLVARLVREGVLDVVAAGHVASS
ncbi:cupin domain-containing protein [Dermatobacter hominis]|uniref:cupin domain-containing protein n=1 Tax=Dermatobacter hominis TaxID=2884263 RepID=UPI001D10622A|nr:cupin domain-containing protein [Dermatobacter hominis]UDY37598.1 cupin domain-containing protein [Dermatobacter hominis]